MPTIEIYTMRNYESLLVSDGQLCVHMPLNVQLIYKPERGKKK